MLLKDVEFFFQTFYQTLTPQLKTKHLIYLGLGLFSQKKGHWAGLINFSNQLNPKLEKVFAFGSLSPATIAGVL